jgi:cytidylate kinase
MSEQFTYLIAIAGPPGSGKSTLAKALSEKSGWRVRSFGGYVREVAKERGLPEDRATLQTLGDALGQEYGEAQFTAKTISEPQPGEAGVIIEGVRKHAQWEEMKNHADQAILVYLDVPYEVAKERLESRNRTSDTAKAYDEIIAHPMELERAALKDIATICLPVDTVENLVDRLYPPTW